MNTAVVTAQQGAKTGPKPRPVIDRFLEKFIPEPMSGCWLWEAATSLCGYGRMGIGGRRAKMWPAHRIAWTLFRGPIPKGMEVAHRCDVRICVNPAHLWLATHTENMADMKQKGRINNGRSYGDANGSRTHPESRPRGDNHWARKGKK